MATLAVAVAAPAAEALAAAALGAVVATLAVAALGVVPNPALDAVLSPALQFQLQQLQHLHTHPGVQKDARMTMQHAHRRAAIGEIIGRANAKRLVEVAKVAFLPQHLPQRLPQHLLQQQLDVAAAVVVAHHPKLPKNLGISASLLQVLRAKFRSIKMAASASAALVEARDAPSYVAVQSPITEAIVDQKRVLKSWSSLTKRIRI